MAVDTATTAIPLGETGFARLRRTITRPVRRAVRFVATSDPDLSRLRTAGTTITCLVVVAIVLFALAAITGQSAAGAIPGLILTMLACNAVREPRPGPRAATILLLIPSSLIAVTIAALTHDVPIVAYIVFVAVAMAAVFIRIIGQPGVPIGMVAFMSYFIAIFTRVTLPELPAVACAVAIAALIVIALRYLLRPRHPDRDLRRMLRALGVRAGRVLDVIDDGVLEGRVDEKLHRTVTSRLAASSSTASAAEQALDAADHALVDGIANAELSVRIFDFQLMLERLHSIVRRVLIDGTLDEAQRRQLSRRLRELRREVHTPSQLKRVGPGSPGRRGGETVPLDTAAIATGFGAAISAPASEGEPDEAAERLESLARVIRFGFSAWQGIVARGPDGTSGRLREQEGAGAGDLDTLDSEVLDDLDAHHDSDGSGSRSTDDHPVTPSGPRSGSQGSLPQLARTAVQVGLAAALAIAAGTALSPTRWFWAVIAAFVVYVGTSTRGEILTKGWQRVVGTLAGVVFGVLVAGLVGGNLPVSLLLIVLSLFFGFYFMQVSSAWMIFGITTMLALLYGLLGEFSVDLLLLRLEETAAGAAIGILVSYVVFPNSTRDAMRADTRVFLAELSSSLETAERRLSVPTPYVGAATVAPDDARALRDAFVALTTTSKPVTQGWAGVSNRSGSRRSLVILGACEYHGRALLRQADGALGAADTEALRDALDRATMAVEANIDAFVAALDSTFTGAVFRPAGDVIDQLEDHPDLDASRRHRSLRGVARHLQAIDLALCGRASEVGATLDPLEAAPRA